MNWYHGSRQPIEKYQKDLGESDLEGMLFLSRSCNVARRYGHCVASLDLDDGLLPKMSIEDWVRGEEPPEDSFVISGAEDSFDFPVDTLVLRSDPGEPLLRVSKERMVELDDGRAIREPTSTKDREWRLFVDDIYCGDIKAWKRDTAPSAQIEP